MSKLNEHAKTLRSVAQSLEDRAKCIPTPTAVQILKKYGPSRLTCRVQLPLYPLMEKGFDHREYMSREMGHRLAYEIAKTLDVQYVMPERIGLYDHHNSATYEATVYAFTPAQLEDFVNKIIQETRNQ